MIIYNVTVNIENDVKEDWLNWMKNIHIPDVMATGYFIEYKICRVLVDEEQGTTFSIQYTAAAMKDLEDYQRMHSHRLQKEHNERYSGKYVAFRTLLEIV
jgi:hypothetical protein